MSFADSGRWAIEVADDYPPATVIGLDLSPMQPEEVPENCEFIIGDLTECLVDFDDGSFDLVHSRLPSASTSFPSAPPFQKVPQVEADDRFIQGGIKADEWPRYVSQVYRLLKPGGYAQMGELACASPISDEGLLPYDAPLAEVAYPFSAAMQAFPTTSFSLLITVSSRAPWPYLILVLSYFSRFWGSE